MAGGRRISTWGWAVLFGLAYLALAEIGHWLSEPAYGAGFTTAWPPSGLYVAALFLARRRSGWFILSAFVAYLLHACGMHHRDVPTSVAFFLADTGEAGIGAWGLYAICGRRVRLNRLRDVLALVGVAAVLAPAIGASLGTPAGLIGSRASYARIWCAWWVVDALGVLLVAPVILSWPQLLWPALRRCRPARVLEFAVLLAGLSVFTAITLKTHPGRLLAVPYPVLPFLVWAALRFGPLETSVAFVVMSVSSFWYATQGPGAAVSRLDDLLQVELFLFLIDISFLILAGVTAERRTSVQILSRNHVLLQAIYRAQADFIGGRDLAVVLERLLKDTQPVTGSTLGFVGEMRRAEAGAHSVKLIAARGAGAPDLRAAALNPEAIRADVGPELRPLIEQVARTGQPVRTRDVEIVVAASGEREIGEFVGLPCHHLGKVVGVLGLAFKSGEYDPTLAPLIPPLLLTCGHLIESERQNDLRRRAESALAQRERELADFFEHASVGVHWLGPDGRILRANQAELALLGYSREEFVGRHFADFHDDPTVGRTMLRRMRDGETLDNFEVKLRARDGSLRHVQVSANAFREANRVVHTRCILRDMTAPRSSSM